MTHCDTCKKTRYIASILRAFTSYHKRVKPREYDIRSLDVTVTVAGLSSSVLYAVACIHHQCEDRQEEKSASSSPHPR